MQAIFDAVQRGQHSVFEAIKAIANISIVKSNGGLSFEILAEAYRNFPVAERLTALVDYYRSGVRQLAALTRPDVTAGELEAYVDIMMACRSEEHTSELKSLMRISYAVLCLKK